MNNKIKSKKITGIALIAALEVALCFISNFIPGFIANINLALVPIIIASILYGPFEGMIIGLINGIITIFAPLTLSFLSFDLFGTIVTCLLKTGLAGLFCGLIYKGLKKVNNLLAIIISSLFVPIINTSLFIAFVYIFFSQMEGFKGQSFENILVIVIGVNFIVELVTAPILSYPILKIIKK